MSHQAYICYRNYERTVNLQEQRAAHPDITYDLTFVKRCIEGGYNVYTFPQLKEVTSIDIKAITKE